MVEIKTEVQSIIKLVEMLSIGLILSYFTIRILKRFSPKINMLLNLHDPREINNFFLDMDKIIDFTQLFNNLFAIGISYEDIDELFQSLKTQIKKIKKLFENKNNSHLQLLITLHRLYNSQIIALNNIFTSNVTFFHQFQATDYGIFIHKKQFCGDIGPLKSLSTNPRGRYLSLFRSEFQNRESNKGIKRFKVFISHSERDYDTFWLPVFAEYLSFYPEIEKVFLRDEKLTGILDYLNFELKQSDIILLICSQNALNSKAVTNEWNTAKKLGKPIIPIFENISDIPHELEINACIRFKRDDIKGTIEEIYFLIKRFLNM
ncbi:MAG TPA: toll/interleukin-1 receptor domain-containing protein [Candidatus Deferrimicrobium sp.]|nr:toll/interleukin-1 receptor domain-containing protein [Candidatus Deferrimicrobium sp.]